MAASRLVGHGSSHVRSMRVLVSGWHALGLLHPDLDLVFASLFELQRQIEAITLAQGRSEEHTSELQSPCNLVCRLLLEKKKKNIQILSHIHMTHSSFYIMCLRHQRLYE